MAQALLTERHAKGIAGIVNCYDRIVISGQLQQICYAKGMTKYLYAHGIRIFDYTQFATPLRAEIRQNAEDVAKELVFILGYRLRGGEESYREFGRQVVRFVRFEAEEIERLGD